MTDLERRFCPRCGTQLVAGLPFCPSCGLNTAEAGRPPVVAREAGDEAMDPLGMPLDAGPPRSRPGVSRTAEDSRDGGRRPIAASRRLADPGSRGSPIVIGALIVAAGLVIFGLLMRPQPASAPPGASPGGTGGTQTVGPGASVGGPPAPIVGLTIESPADGQAVATEEVTVVGLAPPGLTITRDVSFGFDQHATADGTGHWAMTVRLDEGGNDLVFRIGDDRSTEKRLRVTYTPQGR